MNSSIESTACQWSFDPGTNHQLKATVHFLFSTSARLFCASEPLQLQYFECNPRRRSQKSFCNVIDNPATLISCGPVVATVNAGNINNSLVLSYQRKYVNDYNHFFILCAKDTCPSLNMVKSG